MPALNPQTVLTNSPCVTCYGASLVEALEISLLDTISQNIGSSAPAIPANLAATPGDSEVTLTWDDSAGAITYNVYRSLVNGGPYALLLNVATSDHVDATAANGTTYYYVVTAVTAAGESGYSNQASATPADPFNNALVYTRQGLGTTTVNNPVGAFNLTFGANKVTEMHCHNAPGITSITCTSDQFLTTVDLVNCTALATLDLNGATILASIDLTGFTTFTTLALNGCTLLTSATLTNVANCGTLFLHQSGLTSISLPALASSTFVYAFLCPDLLTFSAPALASVVTQIAIKSNTSVSSINLQSLTSCPLLELNDNASLVSVDLSAFENASGQLNASVTNLPQLNLPAYNASLVNFDIKTNPSLVTVTFNNQPIADGGIFDASGCALNEASVDYALQAGIDGAMTSGTIYLDGGTSSAPSAAGLANKAQLILDGVDVQTN